MKVVAYSHNVAIAHKLFRTVVFLFQAVIAALICVFALKGLMSTVFDVYLSERVITLSETLYAKDSKVAELSAEVRLQRENAVFYAARSQSLEQVNRELITTVVAANDNNAKLKVALAAEASKGPLDKLAEEKAVVSTKEALVSATSAAVEGASVAYAKTISFIKSW